jgi:hypothetical protein
MSNGTLRSRMEALAYRLQGLSAGHDSINRPGAKDADYYRGLVAAYAFASEWIRQLLAEEDDKRGGDSNALTTTKVP